MLYFTDEFTASFEYAIHAIKVCRKSDKAIYEAAVALITKIAKQVIENGSANNLISGYKEKLEKEGGIPIQIEVDDTITTAAKIEYAENYNRNFHLLKHKNKSGLTHLIMHELVHLDFAIQAKIENVQMLFTSNTTNKNIFHKDQVKHREQLLKKGIKNESINTFYDGIFSGINLQMYNAPIDLFIEDYLFNNYPDLKPIQFASLLNLLEDGKEAVTNKEVISISPISILSASRVLNLVAAKHFKDLYGIDKITEFNGNKSEMNLADKLYEEYNEYRQDRHAGEEYELVQNWAADLKLDKYFELVNEADYRRRTASAESILSFLQADPLGANDNQSEKDRDMQKFLDNQKEIGLNSAVIFFMVDALQYLTPLKIEQVKKIAIEIAMLGSQGINTDKDSKYKLANIPNQSFTGYKLLSYYYVSFKIAIPEMLPELQLPFDEEFITAEQMFNNQNKS